MGYARYVYEKDHQNAQSSQRISLSARQRVSAFCRACKSATCVAHCALCIVHCTLCTLHCANCNVHCTSCTFGAFGRKPINEPFHSFINVATFVTIINVTKTTLILYKNVIIKTPTMLKQPFMPPTKHWSPPAWRSLILGSVLCGCGSQNANSGCAAGRQS